MTARDDPGGPLVVTTTGNVTVATDEMLANVDRLTELEERVARGVRRVLAADAIVEGLPVDGPLAPLERVATLCARARGALERTAAAYRQAELAAERVQHETAALLAATLGPALVALLAATLLLSPGTLLLAVLGAWAAVPDRGEGRAATLRDLLLAHPDLVTSPTFTRFVSGVATSIDDALLARLGVPPPFVTVPGVDIGPGGGAAAGALTTAALGAMLGMFRETPVAVERVTTSAGVSAATGSRERLDRVPEVDQVRIERYDAPGMPPRYAVYVGPTETFSPFADREPWDLTSNVVGVAGLAGGSFRAVEAAMAEAGIRPGDEVQVVGFSQGGLVATLVAASRDWNVVGVETYGAPAGNIPLPEGVAGLAIRNTDDFVPALAGPQLDTRLVQVEREAFAGDAPIPTDLPAPAHQRRAYEATADAVDAAASRVVRDRVRALDAFAADYLARDGATSTVSVYRAERVSGAGSTS